MWAPLSLSLSLSVCLCVGVWVCVCVCLPVDSGALMLKDVSSFLHCAGLLWQLCWAALMSRMCHCRTFSSGTTAQSDQNGMFILPISPYHPPCTFVSLSSCHSFCYGLRATESLDCHYALCPLLGVTILSEHKPHFMCFLHSSHLACPCLIDTVAAAVIHHF